MKDQEKTKEQLIGELQALRREKTEHQKVEKASAHEVHLFDTLMASIPEFIYFKDAGSRFTRVSRFMAEYFGFANQDEMLGKTDFDFTPGAPGQKRFEEEQEILRTGQPLVDIEESAVWRDGTTKWAATSKMPVFDQDGNAIGTFGISKDITKRKQTEERILYERNLLQTLMMNIPDFIYFKDENRKFVRVSASLGKLFGRTGDELVGKSDEDLFTEEIARESATIDRQIIDTGTPVINREEHALLGDGKDYCVLTTKLPWRDMEGNTVGLLGISREISELRETTKALRESEERFKAFMRHLPFAAYIKDKNLRNVFANEHMRKKLDESVDDVIGSTAKDTKPPPTADRLEKAYRKVLEQDATEELENSMTTKGGQQVYWRDVVFPIHMPNAQLLIGGIAISTTAQKRDQEQISASLREKEVLLQETHHRVKNNMQIVASLSSMQARRTKDEGAKKELQTNHSRIMAMASVHELLYESESLSTIDLGKYIKRLLAGLSEMHLGKKNIEYKLATEEIELDIDRSIPCGILLNELVTNSFKHAFAEDQSGTVNVTVRSINNEIEISVSDDGQGLQNIKAEKSENLGHVLVKGLVENQLNGTWDMTSSDAGTKHTIRFNKAE